MGKKKKASPPVHCSSPRDKISFPARDPADPARGPSVASREKELWQARVSSVKGAAPPEAEKDPSSYYHLNIQAVEDLAGANEENSPPVSKAELKKYRSVPQVKLADWFKALLLKWWAGGMICYFFVWGLSTFAMNPWDHLAVLGLALGLVTNLIVNNIYRFIARVSGAYDRWMMFPGKQLWNFPLDLLYGMLLVFCTVQSYNTLNLLFSDPAAASPALGVEPILFGALITLWDLLFLGMKRLGKRIWADARRQTGNRH